MLMGMFRFGRGRWSLSLQDDWQAEVEDGTTCISRPDGDGVLLLSSADKEEGVVELEDLAALARGECPGDASVGPSELGDFRGVHAMYAADGVRWHRWYLGYGSFILLATYMVPLELEGSEDDAVMSMLRTLQGRGGAWE